MMFPLFFMIPLAVTLVSILLLAWLRWGAFSSLMKLATEQRQQSLPASETSSHHSLKEERHLPPRVSIVVPCENDGWWVERHLEYLLKQNFDRFEVIVADASDAEDSTAHFVKRLQMQYPHLRYTAVPEANHNIVRRKLTLTLGVKAAWSPWVVFINPEGAPDSPNWLAHLASHFHDETDVVMGYANYDDSVGSPGRRAVLQRAHRFAQQVQALSRGTVVGCDACNVALRREWFLAQGGFADSLALPYGECLMLVTLRAQADRVAVVLHPEAKVRIPLPDAVLLREERQRQREVHRLLRHRCCWTFVRDSWASSALCLAQLSTLLFVLTRVAYFFGGSWLWLREVGIYLPTPSPVYAWMDLLYDVPAFVLLVVLMTLPIRSARRWLSALGEEGYGFYIYVYEWLQPWRASR